MEHQTWQWYLLPNPDVMEKTQIVKSNDGDHIEGSLKPD